MYVEAETVLFLCEVTSHVRQGRVASLSALFVVRPGTGHMGRVTLVQL